MANTKLHLQPQGDSIRDDAQRIVNAANPAEIPEGALLNAVLMVNGKEQAIVDLAGVYLIGY